MSETSKITAIKALRSDADRATVRIGKKTAATIPWEQIQQLGLRVGQTWDDALAERVGAIAASDQVRRDALRLINRRDYSSGELRFKLKTKGHAHAQIDIVVERMIDKGLVDDEAYGRSVIHMERARKPAGVRLLRQKLMLKRLPRALIDQLLTEAEVDHDAVGQALKLAEAKLDSAPLQRCEPIQRRQRVWSLLARRGFNPDTIHAAMARLVHRFGSDASATDE